jgi:DnaJ-domain-containing protein 1
MTDSFALLDEPRRPWLDPEALKEKIHKLSVVHHPDVARDDGSNFTALNAAYKTLHDPKTRVRHLLELEFPGALATHLEIPPDIARLFETMTRERQSVASFLEKKARLSTPLELALIASEQVELMAVLERLRALLEQKQEGILVQLKFVDAVWEDDRERSGKTLLDIYQSVSYVGKWIDQIREDLLKMSHD